MKKPEIVATIGFSYIEEKGLLDKLVQSGIRYFRFNFCKCEDLNLLKQKAELIQVISEKYKGYIHILLDIPYPGKKPRIAFKNKEKIDITKDEYLVITSNANYKDITHKKIVLDVDELEEKIDVTRPIVYSDGECTFDVIDYVDKNVLLVKSNRTQTIYNRKSLTIGYIDKRSSINEEYINMISYANVNSIALSFVTDYKEASYFKNIFPKHEIISKIECPEGINEVDNISKVSSIMLGRGDLCLTADCYSLYFYQKKVAEACKVSGSKLYIATGILSSLNSYSSPIQSDIIDVSNLLLLSPDYLILNYSVLYNNSSLVIKTIDNIYSKFK